MPSPQTEALMKPPRPTMICTAQAVSPEERSARDQVAIRPSCGRPLSCQLDNRGIALVGAPPEVGDLAMIVPHAVLVEEAGVFGSGRAWAGLRQLPGQEPVGQAVLSPRSAVVPEHLLRVNPRLTGRASQPGGPLAVARSGMAPGAFPVHRTRCSARSHRPPTAPRSSSTDRPTHAGQDRPLGTRSWSPRKNGRPPTAGNVAFTRGDGRAAKRLHAMKRTLLSEGGPLASEDVPTETEGTRRATRRMQEPGQGLRQCFSGS